MKINQPSLESVGGHSLFKTSDAGHRLGHLLPGCCFLLISIGYLSTIFVRVLNGSDIKEMFPEKNKMFLRNWGAILAILSWSLALYEGLGGLISGFGFFFQMAHIVLYLFFSLVSVASVLETFNFLPLDSWRVVASVAFFVASIIWNSHASMQSGSEQSFHIYLGEINRATAVTFAYSVYQPTNAIAILISLSLILLQGLWFLTITLGLFCGETLHIPNHRVGLYLSLECLIVTSAVLTAAVFLNVKYRLKEESSEIRFQKVLNEVIDCDSDEEESEGQMVNPVSPVEML